MEVETQESRQERYIHWQKRLFADVLYDELTEVQSELLHSQPVLAVKLTKLTGFGDLPPEYNQQRRKFILETRLHLMELDQDTANDAVVYEMAKFELGDPPRGDEFSEDERAYLTELATHDEFVQEVMYIIPERT